MSTKAAKSPEQLALEQQIADALDVKAHIYNINPTGGKRADLSLLIGDAFCIRNVKLMEGPTGQWLSMPRYKVGDDFKDYCYGLTDAFRTKMLNVAQSSYNEALQQTQQAGQAPAQQQGQEATNGQTPQSKNHAPNQPQDQQMAGM